MPRDDVYRAFRSREERALAGYHRGVVTAGELQYEACLAGLAAVQVERVRPRGRRLPVLRTVLRRLEDLGRPRLDVPAKRCVGAIHGAGA